MSDRVWTPAQSGAINADTGTLLVSAAAGSGKTAVLVERIVRLLTRGEAPVRPSELLVVTFTNAAAAEMRSRVYSRISDLMRVPGADRSSFSALLSHLDEMNVCTMDAFGIKLVRESFHICGVSSDFTVLDKGESDILKKETAADVAETVFADFPEQALSLAKLFQYGRTDEKLLKAIVDLSDFSMAEPDPEAWLNGVTALYTEQHPDDSEWGRIIADEVKTGLDEMRRLAEKNIEDLMKVPEIYTYKNVADIFNSVSDICGRAAESFNSLPWDEKIVLLNKTSERLHELPRLTFPRDCTKDPIKLACVARRDFIKDFFDRDAPKLMCATASEHLDDVRRLTPDARLLITAVRRFNEELLRRKKERNSYDFSDILHFALGLLYDPSARDGKTDAARALSEQFREILIDEYQDTNRAQDMLFSCLSKNGRNMFTVGDVKQSIYRFRLASPEIFIEKSESFPAFDGRADRSKIVLKNNFRSRRGVLDAVNYMFNAVMSKECGEIEYNDDERLSPPPGKENDPPTADFEMHTVDGDGVKDEAEYTARLIAEVIASGAVVNAGTDCARKADYGDFCILLRSAKNTSSLFSAALRRRGIPVSVEAKDGFFESSEVRLAMSLLHVADNPSNDTALLAVMMSPLFGFTPDEAARVRIDTADTVPEKAGLWARVSLLAENGYERCRELRDAVRGFRRDTSLQNAGQAVRAVFDSSGIISVMGALPDGELRRGNLRRIISLAESYSVDPSRTLGAFVRYLDALCANGASIKRAGGAGEGSVRIMTMHGSKGLEFPFVIIAGLTKNFNDGDLNEILVTEHTLGVGLKVREPSEVKSYATLSSTALRILKKRASRSEELRILYVAMTRAREKLYVVAADRLKNLDRINALASCASPVPPYLVRNAGNLFEWFLYAFMHHPDAHCLRRGDVSVIAADFPAVFRAVSPDDEAGADCAAAEKADSDACLTAKLADRMTLKYEYLPVASALAKHTASTLHAEKFTPEFFGDKVPSFLGSRGLSPTETGTATHLFLQYCDFDAAKNDTEKEKLRLVDSGRITSEQADCLDVGAVKAFTESALFDAIKRADAVYREKRFTVSESVCTLDSSIPERFRDEQTVVIGKIDLIYIKNGEAVIVDYKTDTVTDENVLVNRYREQLALYARAAERTLNCRVTQCVIYSLKGRKAIFVGTDIF